MEKKNNSPKWRSVISKDERLTLIGLMHLAHQSYKEADRCDKAMHKIIGSKEKYTLISDEWLEGEDVDEVLKNMSIKVK